MMMRFFHSLLVLFVMVAFLQCKEEKIDPAPLNKNILPAGTQIVDAQLNKLNCWTERGQFFATGVCCNPSEEWRKLWLELHFVDANGKPVALNKHAGIIVNTFSDAIPPYGCSSFYVSWPLKNFSATPANCVLQAAHALKQTEGPILVVPMANSLKMIAPVAQGQTTTQELGWQVSGTLSNPSEKQVAAHPHFEVMVYGTDNNLWFSALVNPEDPSTRTIFEFLERQGPLQPLENRYFMVKVFYQALPDALKSVQIGRVDVSAFEGR